MTEILRLPMPERWSRVESGPIQFGEDWPGVFFRGDNALFFAIAVAEATKQLRAHDASWTLLAQLEGLVRDFRACSVGNTGWPPVAQP